MKQFFDERMLGAREGKIEGGREGKGARKDKPGGARKRVGGDFRGGAAISTYFHGSDFSGPGGRVTVSAVFTSRGNYIKSFCKGREN